MAKREDIPRVEVKPLPDRVTVGQRAFYEVGNSGFHRDLQPGEVVVDKQIIAEIINLKILYY